jgi:glycosyltransferase involved in cell wall biosynthesis
VICAFWLVSLGAPVVYEVHDLESRHPSAMKGARLAAWLARIDERTLRGARAVVSLTQTFKDELVRLGWQPAGRVFVVPDAYDEANYYPRSREEARAGLNLPDDALVIGYAGLTFAYRRLDLLFEALRIWNEPRVRALIIGGRPFEVQELERRARELNLDGAILWRGRQTAEATARDLSAADILVIPDTVTDATASPLKMFEYMALGRAIVAVDRPALREVLAEGAAEFFRAGDPADFARALRAVAGSEERRRALSAHAVESAGEYTYAKRAEKILQACMMTTA